MSYRQIPQNAVDQMVFVTLPKSTPIGFDEVNVTIAHPGESFQFVEVVERLDALGDHVDGGWTHLGDDQYALCLPDEATSGAYTRVIVQHGPVRDIIDIDVV
jgi:hypothetical protein